MGIPFIPARNFTRGRLAPVDFLVLHTAEGARDVRSLGRWFQTDYPGSAHSGVDDHGDRADYVRFTDTAWGAPPCNSDGEHLELCGFAAWSEAVWMDEHRVMLDAAAAWLAERARANRIPLRVKVGTSLQNRERGVTMHYAITDVWHESTHQDPGHPFPIGYVVDKAAKLQTTRTVGPVTVKRKPPTTTATPTPRLARTLRIGVAGVDVLALQRRLIARGWTVAKDGVYGPATAAAVGAFQHHAGLTADGVCGPLTWAALWQLPIKLPVAVKPATI